MLNDRALVEGSLRGDAGAFAELVRRYQAPLLASAYHLLGHAEDAQDLAQETFIEAFRRLATLREGEKLRGWLFTILRHKCLHFLRERRPAEISLELVEDTLAAPAPAFAGQDVWVALQRLPLPDREILAARYLQELSFAEIAAVLGISENNAVVRCSRARARLRDVLREMDEEETRALMRKAISALPVRPHGRNIPSSGITGGNAIDAYPGAGSANFPANRPRAGGKTDTDHPPARAGCRVESGAVVAVAVIAIGAVKFVAPRPASTGRTATAGITLAVGMASGAAVLPAAGSPVNLPAAGAPTPSAPTPIKLAAAPGDPARKKPVQAMHGTPSSKNASGSARGTSPYTVTGKVVNPDGKPIAGAKIYIYLFDTRKSFDFSAGAEGEFAVEVNSVLPRSDNSIGIVTAYAPGYLQLCARLKWSNNTLTLSASTTLSGTVVDTAGKPLAGVPVRLSGWHDTTPSNGVPWISSWAWRKDFTAVTAAGGAFTLPAIPPNGTASLFLDDDRFVRAGKDITLVAGKPTAPVQLIARPGAIVTGRVLTPEGLPAAHAVVHCTAMPENRNSAVTTGWAQTAMDGSYRITGLATGSYRLYADSDDDAWLGIPLTDIALREGRQTKAPELHTHAGALLQGTVVDAETGLPLPHAGVWLESITRFGDKLGRTGVGVDATGDFHFRTPPTRVTIQGEDLTQGYTQQMAAEAQTVDLPEGKSVTVTVKLHKGETVTGTVTDEDGKPAAGVSFDITTWAGVHGNIPLEEWRPPFTTDQSGHFALYGLSAGSASIMLRQNYDAGDKWDLPGQLTIRIPAQAPLSITVKHIVLHTVTGRVVDTEHRPLAGVCATSHESFELGPTLTLTAVTGADGSYRWRKSPRVQPSVCLRWAKQATAGTPQVRLPMPAMTPSMTP